MNKLIFLFLLFVVTTTNSSEIVNFFNNTKSISADFIQVTYNKNKNIHTTSGNFVFSHPKKFIWQINKPSSQIFLLNNNELWFIDKDLEQAILQNSSSLKNTPLYWITEDNNTLSFAYKKNNIKWYETKKTIQKQYKNLLFGFKKQSLYRIKFENELNQTIIITLKNLIINKAVNPKIFSVAIDPQFEIIK
jgi:outer membrane lipoprotein-sorting protein